MRLREPGIRNTKFPRCNVVISFTGSFSSNHTFLISWMPTLRPEWKYLIIIFSNTIFSKFNKYRVRFCIENQQKSVPGVSYIYELAATL